MKINLLIYFVNYLNKSTVIICSVCLLCSTHCKLRYSDILDSTELKLRKPFCKTHHTFSKYGAFNVLHLIENLWSVENLVRSYFSKRLFLLLFSSSCCNNVDMNHFVQELQINSIWKVCSAAKNNCSQKSVEPQVNFHWNQFQSR